VSVAEAMRQARHASGLTLRAAARRFGLDEATLCRYERGHRPVPVDIVMRSPGVYGTPLVVLAWVREMADQAMQAVAKGVA